jgi:hypothetical protein
MTVNLSMLAGAGAQFFDNNGNPLSGGKLYSYQAGTTTPQATYTTNAGNTAHANPIILDSAGRVPSGGEIWLTDALIYKFVVASSTDVLVGTYDYISGNGSGILSSLAASGGSGLIGFLQAGTGATTRTVQSKLRDFVSVKDYGAVGNGVADDTAAILAALAANADSAVWFPSGTYLVSAVIENTTSCSMYGYGQAIIKLADGVNLGSDYQDRVVWIHDCEDVVIDGMTIDENKRGGTFATGSLLLTRCDRAKVTNNLIYDNDGMGITCGGEFGSAGECDIVLIDRNIVYPLTAGTSGTNKSQEGIKTAENRRVTITNNYMRTFYDDGISLNGRYFADPTGYNNGDRDIVIANNVIEAWSRAIVIDGWCENVVISGNTCRKMNLAPISFGQPLILITNVISSSIATSYARNVSIVGNVCEVNTDYSTEVSGIGVNCGVGIVISGNSIRKDGAAAPTKPGIDIAPTAPAVKTLIGVKIADNSIHGYENGVYVAASGSDWPIDIAIDGNLIENVTNPVYFVGAATAARNWSVSNNKTNSPNNIVWAAGAAGVVQDDGNNSWNYSFGMPTSGTYTKGQKIWNTDVANGRPVGWVAVDSGAQITAGQNLLSAFDSYKRFQIKTANYAIQPSENGTRYSNLGASGIIVFTLTQGFEGFAFQFSAITGFAIEVNVGSGDNFVGGVATKMTIPAYGYASITCDGNIWVVESTYGAVTLS